MRDRISQRSTNPQPWGGQVSTSPSATKGEHRAERQPEDLFGDRAPQGLAHTGAAMRASNDQVHLVLLEQLREHLAKLARTQQHVLNDQALLTYTLRAPFANYRGSRCERRFRQK